MRAYVINLHESKSKSTHWIALYLTGNNIICFDSFGVKHIPKEIKKFTRNQNTKINTFRIQTYHLIM